MKLKRPPLNERGIAHLDLIIVLVAVVGIGGFAALRVSNANQVDSNPPTSQSEVAEVEASEGLTPEETQADKNATELEQAETDLEQRTAKPLGAEQESDDAAQ